MTGLLEDVEPFEPLRPVPRRRLIARAVIAPFLWLVAVLVAAIVVERTNAIGMGLLIALGSMVFAVLALATISALRDRERRKGPPDG